MYVLDKLQQTLEESGSNPSVWEPLQFSPLLVEHEIAQALYARLTSLSGLSPYIPRLHPLSSGAIPLFGRLFFPWEGLPYPREHAQLGVILAQLVDNEMRALAERMIPYQEATLDHSSQPIYPLFLQVGGRVTYEEIVEANRGFFTALGHTPSPTREFYEPDLGLISMCRENTTLLCIGSGCKSGMGTFLYHKAGIINYGPQLLPIGENPIFGLAGRGEHIRLVEKNPYLHLSYRCRLAGASSRETGLVALQDSDYAGWWLTAEMEGDIHELSIRTHFSGFIPAEKMAMAFYGRGEECIVEEKHKLKPRSLDRYRGPPGPVACITYGKGISISHIEGATSMEIIPLAGDDRFWRADFLLLFTLDPTARLSFRFTPYTKDLPTT